METTYLELLEVARLLRERALSVHELVSAQLARIERLDPQLHAFARYAPERALARASTLDAELGAGHYRGALHGVPLALKDLFFERGEITAAGTAIHRDFRADTDATVVQRLTEAGAILLGSLQLTEGAYATHLPPIVPPRNPWHRDYWSGASSSGSGVAVAAGLCFGSFGTETGGSIHLPSAVNGVTGLKPTWGRVSRYGMFELAATLDHVGPLARSAADAGALLRAVAGADVLDPTAARLAVPDYVAGLRHDLTGLRIGLDPEFAFGGVDALTVAAVTQAIDDLQRGGARLVALKFPDVSQMVADWFPVCAVQTAVAHEASYPARKAEYGQALADLIELGRGLSGMEYQRLILRREAFKGQLNALFDAVDLLVLPVMTFAETTLARMLKIDDELIMGVHRYTCAFTMSGHPAITFPCGRTASDTPISCQLVGRHFDENLLIAAAHAFQQATDWHRKHPAL